MNNGRKLRRAANRNGGKGKPGRVDAPKSKRAQYKRGSIQIGIYEAGIGLVPDYRSRD